MTRTRKIAIIGAGPGGLTLARLLQMSEFDVVVYERDSSHTSRDQGATLDLHDDAGLKALQAADLMDAFRASYRPGADRLIIVDQNVRVCLNEFDSSDLGPERPEIDRGPLRNLLLASLRPGTVVWNRQFLSLAEMSGSIHLTFAGSVSESADIVVGADGGRSRVRPYITPIRPIYSGVTVIEGNVANAAVATPEIQRLLGNGKICALGGEKSLFVSSKGDGSLAFYTGHRTEEFWFRDSGVDFAKGTEVLAWFKQEFSGWSTFWDALFEQAEPNLVPRPQYHYPLDQTWDARPNMTMIGDAAHLMPPYAGEGVNMAMLDALELAQCFGDNRFQDFRSAVAAYELKMRERASATTQMTLEQTAAFHSPSALALLIEFFQSHVNAQAKFSEV